MAQERDYGFDFSSIVFPRRACLENLIYLICFPLFIFRRCIDSALNGDRPSFDIPGVLMHFWRLSHTLMHMVESVYACAMSQTRGSRDWILSCRSGLIYRFYPLNSQCVGCVDLSHFRPMEEGGRREFMGGGYVSFKFLHVAGTCFGGPQWDGHTAVQMRHSCFDHETP